MVRKLAKQEIHRRFKKYPKSRVAVIPFSGCAAPLFDDGKEDHVDAAVDQLACQLTIRHANGSETSMDGGTHIMTAIAVAALAWVSTIGLLLFGLYTEHLPSEEGSMIFYLILQAVVPTAVFWFMMHR